MEFLRLFSLIIYEMGISVCYCLKIMVIILELKHIKMFQGHNREYKRKTKWFRDVTS